MAFVLEQRIPFRSISFDSKILPNFELIEWITRREIYSPSFLNRSMIFVPRFLHSRSRSSKRNTQLRYRSLTLSKIISKNIILNSLGLKMGGNFFKTGIRAWRISSRMSTREFLYKRNPSIWKKKEGVEKSFVPRRYSFPRWRSRGLWNSKIRR